MPHLSEPGVGPPDDELVGEDRHGHVLDKVLQRLGPAQHQRLVLGLFERFGEEDRAIQCDPRRAVRADGVVHPHDPVGGRSVQDRCAARDGLFLRGQYGFGAHVLIRLYFLGFNSSSRLLLGGHLLVLRRDFLRIEPFDPAPL